MPENNVVGYSPSRRVIDLEANRKRDEEIVADAAGIPYEGSYGNFSNETLCRIVDAYNREHEPHPLDLIAEIDARGIIMENN